MLLPSENAARAEAQALAHKQLAKRAVKVNDPRRDQRVKASPYLVNFLPYPYQNSEVNPGTGFYTNTVAQAEGPDGLLIAGNQGRLDIPIVMTRDTAFHMLYVKYGAFNPSIEEGDPVMASREMLVDPATSLQGGPSLFDATMNQRIPYYSLLDVSLYFTSSGARDLYGGFAHEQASCGDTLASGGPYGINTRAEIPIPVKSLQGQEDGMAMIRTPYQLPAAATIMVRVTNHHQFALRVYGCLFGYKIPL
jgi:hypothetical protein